MNPVISSSLMVFLNIVYNHLLLTRKRSIKYASVVFIINFSITTFAYIFTYIFLKQTIFFRYMPYVLGFTFIIYISLVFEESLPKKIFTMFTIWLFSNIILIISSDIISLFSIKDFNLFISYSRLLRSFIQLMFIPIIFLCFNRFYKDMLKIVSNKVINIISFYSFMVFVFLIRYYELFSTTTSNTFGIFNSLLFIIIIILSYIIIFIAIWSVNKNVELEYKVKIINTQVESQKQNYKTLNKSLENHYAFKHDIRHHFLAIKSIMDTKNYIAASEYLDKFNENEIYQNSDVICENFTIDSILKYYMGIAIKDNIDFKANVNIPQDINIDSTDLSIVIGNCIENAIEACNKIINKSQKHITIKAEIKGFNLIFKIKNSFNGQVIKEGNIIKSSKGTLGHGIGLYSVKKMVEKYNGYFDVIYSDSEFEISVIMNSN